MVVELAAAPWADLPQLAGVNIYYAPPAGAIQVPAIVYRPDTPWIERRTSYKAWAENYAGVCIVAPGVDGVATLYDLVRRLKAAVDSDPALAAWEWKSVGGIVEAEQAGLTYLAAAVRLSFTAEY